MSACHTLAFICSHTFLYLILSTFYSRNCKLCAIDKETEPIRSKASSSKPQGSKLVSCLLQDACWGTKKNVLNQGSLPVKQCDNKPCFIVIQIVFTSCTLAYCKGKKKLIEDSSLTLMQLVVQNTDTQSEKGIGLLSQCKPHCDLICSFGE